MFDAREDIIGLFKRGTFPYKGDVFKIKEEKLEDEPEEEEPKDDFKNFVEYIENKSRNINYDLFENYFNHVVSSALAKKLCETKNKKKNDKLVEKIKNSWSNLKDGIEKMSEDEKEFEQPDKILKIVKEILNFNRQEQGQGLKILTPNQMLCRLPISLAQLKAGNNSEKLKNEIRQLLYSLNL